MNVRAHILAALGLMMAGCGASVPDVPEPVLPCAPEPTTFTRAYSLTENASGTLRVFAKEDVDATQLFIMKKDGGKWGSPALLDLPHRETLTTPSFSKADDRLYYSSDAKLPYRDRGVDLNIWRVELSDDGVPGKPEALPGEINTGAHEISPAMDSSGRLYFTSNHSRAGGGGFDIMMARQSPHDDKEWSVETMPEGFNDRRDDAHLAVTSDGTRLFFYSHRAPKAGQVDIWTSIKDSSGNWAMPTPLGPLINTEAIEYGAGLSGDDTQFFFSRDGKLFQISLAAVLADAESPAGDS